MTSRGSIIKRDIPAAVEQDVLAEGRCHYCGDRRAGLQVEHVVPLSRGGTNARSNLVAACVSCNNQKRALLLHEWIAYRASNGMPWPPPATHATESRHFPDRCRACERELPGLSRVIYKADRVEPKGAGWKCFFSCEWGHVWTCWYRLDGRYYSDCACSYCIARRLAE